LEHNSGFIADEESLFFYGANFGSDVIEDVEHCRRFESVFQITNAKYRNPIIDVDIGIVIEEFSKGSIHVLAQF
jgi:predicted RNase H-like nuclease